MIAEQTCPCGEPGFSAYLNLHLGEGDESPLSLPVVLCSAHHAFLDGRWMLVQSDGYQDGQQIEQFKAYLRSKAPDK